ncbi:MAG TPA: chalcone isomerase family protein [Candidatus Polarisedimenticolia bacterium]|nr:chalcone isomerase family protein [Candidatus Polarisedimenticolia bacterium]
MIVSLIAPQLAYAAPEQIQVEGETLLQAGQAKREELTFDLYRVSLYLPSRDASMQRITQESVPKAFHVEVLYDGSVPGGIPEDWSEELMPTLPEEKEQKLRQIYQSLGQGDELRIAYAPGAATSVKLNGETVFTDPGYELMAGTVDIFLGPDPVAENVRQGLLGRAEDDGWLF